MRFALVIAVAVLAGCISQPAKHSAISAITQPVTLPAGHTVLAWTGNGNWQPTADDIAALEADLSQQWIKPDDRMISPDMRHMPEWYIAERSKWKLSDFFIRYHGTTVNGKKSSSARRCGATIRWPPNIWTAEILRSPSPPQERGFSERSTMSSPRLWWNSGFSGLKDSRTILSQAVSFPERDAGGNAWCARQKSDHFLG
jgi:hypothetical protein